MKQFRWVGAFLALACSLTRGPAQSLGWLGAASVILGAAIHIVDSSISGFGLTVLAHAWRARPQLGRTSSPSLNGRRRSASIRFACRIICCSSGRSRRVGLGSAGRCWRRWLP